MEIFMGYIFLVFCCFISAPMALFMCFLIPIGLWSRSRYYYNSIKEKKIGTPGLFVLFSFLIIIIPFIYLIFNVEVQNYININKIYLEYVSNHFYILNRYSGFEMLVLSSMLFFIAVFIYILVCCRKLSNMKLKKPKDSKIVKLLKYGSIPIIIFSMIFLCLYNYKDTIKQLDNSIILKEEADKQEREELLKESEKHKDNAYNYLSEKYINFHFTLNSYFYSDAEDFWEIIAKGDGRSEFARSVVGDEEYYMYEYYCEELDTIISVLVDSKGDIFDNFVDNLSTIIASKLNLNLNLSSMNKCKENEKIDWIISDYNMDFESTGNYENILDYISYSDFELYVYYGVDGHLRSNYEPIYESIVREFINSYVSIINQKTNSNIISFILDFPRDSDDSSVITVNINNNTFSYTIDSTYYEHLVNP